MREAIPIIMLAAMAASAASPSAVELSRQANELYQQARYTEAEPLYRKALDAWSGDTPEARRERAANQCSLGALLRAQGRYGEAEQLLTEALATLESDGDANQLTRARYNLAALYRDRGDLNRAETLAKRAAEGAPRSMLASARLVLGSIYVEQGRPADAEPVVKAMLGDADGPQAMAAFTLLTTISMHQRDYNTAEEYARKALYFAKASLPARHQSLATAWNNLAQACRFQGHYLEAERSYREAISIWEETLGPSHPDLAKGLINFAGFYHDRGRESGAEALYTRAVGILEKAFGKDNVRVLAARNELADVFRAERRYTESDRLSRTTLAALERTLSPGDPRLIQAQKNREQLLRETPHRKKAPINVTAFRDSRGA